MREVLLTGHRTRHGLQWAGSATKDERVSLHHWFRYHCRYHKHHHHNQLVRMVPAQRTPQSFTQALRSGRNQRTIESGQGKEQLVRADCTRVSMASTISARRLGGGVSIHVELSSLTTLPAAPYQCLALRILCFPPGSTSTSAAKFALWASSRLTKVKTSIAFRQPQQAILLFLDRRLSSSACSRPLVRLSDPACVSHLRLFALIP